MARAADCSCRKETPSSSLFRTAVRSELRFVVIRSSSRSEVVRSLKRQRITLVGVKWRFLNNEQSKFQLGVYPQVLLPTGDLARGLGEGRSAFVFPVVAQKSWEKWHPLRQRWFLVADG